MHNKTPITEQIRILRQILKEIEQEVTDTEIYWSVENNTLGEAALVVIAEMGEENIPGTLISQPKSSNRGHRKGFTTTNKSKLEACSRLKNWIETGKMVVNSEALLQELKTFIARGSSFAAKSSETDDLVMASVLVVRIAQQVAQYDEVTYEELKDSFDEDGTDAPMPIMVF